VQIQFISVMVDDQDKALHFYSDILGFVKKADLPMGSFRWLTVTSPEGIEGVELVLEPTAFPPSQEYQKALFDAGIPSTAFISKDIHSEYHRLKQLGVIFRSEPTTMGRLPRFSLKTPAATLSTWFSL